MVSPLGPAFPVVWTISMGVLLGVLVVAVVYGVAALISRKAALLLEELIFDGILKHAFYVSLGPSAIALLLMVWAPVQELFRQLRLVLVSAAAPRSWPELTATAPDALVMLAAAAFVVLVFLIGLGLRLALPKVAAVAYTTAKEGMAQPLFWVGLSLGGFLLLLFIWLPYNTFGEDLKMLKIQGLELLTPLAILLAVAAASVSVAQEVEGRTALTVLSKPIGRRQFVVGKFLGVLGPVLVMFLVLGFVYLATVSYKTVYEGYENGNPDISAADCREQVVTVVPGLVLRFMEAAMLAAISVAVSTRLPMLANFAICGLAYVVGHLAPKIVQSVADRQGAAYEFVRFIGQLIATVFPVLENYDVQAGITAAQTASSAYMVMAGLYCLCYCTFVLLGALFLFEDRDLA